MNPTVYVGLIEWADELGVDPYIFVAGNELTARKTMHAVIVRAWEAEPDSFYDEAPEWLGEHADDDVTDPAALEAWLTDFHDSTTAPFTTITERQVIL